MKKSFLMSLVAVLALIAMTVPAVALESFRMRESDNPNGPAGAPTPCPLTANRNGNCSGTNINYRWYNVCAGYIWLFNAWSAGEAVGVQYGGATMPCVTPGHRVKRVIYYFRNVVPNYNQTVDCFLDSDCNGDGCPDAVLGTQLNVDPGLRWNCVDYGVCIPCNYVIGRQRHDGGTAPNFATDGPYAAVCDPSHPSPSHSYYYGINGSGCGNWDLSAPTPPDDFLQWIVVDTDALCPSATENTSWGKVKGLYQ